MPYRSMVQPPRLRNITQGSVFNHARSDDFGRGVLGMVISARCDLAQKKQHKFIYVPMVKITDWADFYLIPKLMEELRKSLVGELKGLLVKNKKADSAIGVFGAEKCAELLVGLKDYESYLGKLSVLRRVELSIESGVYDRSLLSAKNIGAKISDVISNKLEGFFFVDNVVDYQDGGVPLGSYVAILGEPRPIHKNAALGIAEGLDHGVISSGDPVYYSIACVEGEMSYVLCNVSSPYIELALQRFSYFYSRIGVADPSAEIRDLIVSEIMG